MAICYTYDSQNTYVAMVEFDPYGPVPENSTLVAPPLVVYPQVAQWQGGGWVILSERPPAPPEPTPAPPPAVILNKVDFLRLFTQTERINIRAAAAVNSVVADYQYMLDAATTVNLSDPDILAGVPLLEQAGLIGPGRAAQILANEPPA